MDKPLLDVIFASEKRRNVLLLLKDGPREMEEILSHINTTRQVLLPQMKILEKHYLITHHKDTCELTSIGKLIVDEMIPLLDTVNFFNGEDQYWGTHKLDFLPSHLLEKISELGEYRIIKPSLADSFELNQRVIETGYISEFFYVVCAYYHTDMSELFFKMADNKVDVHYMVTRDVLGKIQTIDRVNFTHLMNNKLFHLYVHPKMDFIGFSYNEHSIVLRLLKNDGNPDSAQIECFNPGAVEWAKELFDHCLKNAVQITEI